MAISTREVKNKRTASGELTGREGVVYDVNIKYKRSGKYKSYSKKGFPTRALATQHEAEMKAKLSEESYIPPSAKQAKLTMREYMQEWVENHGQANLRFSTFSSYKSHIRNHITPYIGDIPIGKVTPAMLDEMFQKLYAKGLSQSTVRYAHRIIGVAMEHAMRYGYIDNNPARKILTRFGKAGKTPDPYTSEQVRQLLSGVLATEWEMVVALGVLYGLRRNEILGLRWRNVDLENKVFHVVEQLPFKVPAGALAIEEMAPVKSQDRSLPITEWMLPYFERQLEQQKRNKDLLRDDYYDNDLVIAKSNGAPWRDGRVSADFSHLLRKLDLPHIRFHDTRHTAATNMHELTGDFYTVGEILGHTLKGIGMSLGISTNLEAVTAQYVDVRLDRKMAVLNTYHQAVFQMETPMQT